MAADEKQKKELSEKPILDTLEIINSDPGMFTVMLEAMIRYVSVGENADDCLNVKWAMIAIQLRAVQQAVHYVLPADYDHD